MPKSILRDSHVYVACETEDDLPHIESYVGEDNLVIGTDYGHADLSSELLALQHLRRRRARSDPERQRRLLDDNARALYAL